MEKGRDKPSDRILRAECQLEMMLGHHHSVCCKHEYHIRKAALRLHFEKQSQFRLLLVRYIVSDPFRHPHVL